MEKLKFSFVPHFERHILNVLNKGKNVLVTLEMIIFIKGRKFRLSQPHETQNLGGIVSEPTLDAIFFLRAFYKITFNKGGPTKMYILYRKFCILF